MTRRIAVALLLLTIPLLAQRGPDYDRSVVSQVRIDLRELGYPPVDAIPSDESAVRALTVAPNGALYGVTSGKRSHLFVLYPVHGYVQPLGFLKGVSVVHRSLVVSKSGDVYVGGGGTDGHLFKYTPNRDENKPIRIDAPCEVSDLGAPVAGEGVYALAIDRQREVIYGLSYPNGQFFSYSIPAAKFTVHGKVAERKIPGEKFENEKNLGREIALDADGNAYASGENGALFRFAVAAQKLERLDLKAPTVPGREPYNGVDTWTSDGRGNLYGGTSDGYLFRFNPARMEIANLGKPLNQYRIRGLVFSRNGKLYGVGGDDEEMARLFSYDTVTRTYELLGFVDVNRRPYYMWQAYVIDAMAIGADDTVYLGQSERRSKLYLYYPEPAARRAPGPRAQP